MSNYKMRPCPFFPSIMPPSLHVVLSPSSVLSQLLCSQCQMEEDASISSLLHLNPQAF